MAGYGTPHFQNSGGHRTIEVGVRQFMCMGALPPMDHPHVYLDMSDDPERVCPYCSTLFRFNNALQPEETIPANCRYLDQATD